MYDYRSLVYGSQDKSKTTASHVYTGPGKGKTTATIGLVARALGADLTVTFVQFMKGPKSSEVEIIESLGVDYYCQGYHNFVPDGGELTEYQIAHAKSGLDHAFSSNKDLIVCDEILVAEYYGEIELQEIIDLMKNKEGKAELVMTGRYCHPEIMRRADYVSRIDNVKHPYDDGLFARLGIEY